MTEGLGLSTASGEVVSTVRRPALPLDDATLVARARDGDVGAFETLVDRHQTPIFRYAVRMLGNRSDAEDVVQEVFLACWRRLPELRADAAFSGWLYRSTTNRCLNVLRAQRPRAEMDLDLLESSRADGQPERAAEAVEQVAALTTALSQLTAEQRAAWLLREIHGRPYREIAGILGTSVDAVRGRIARARAELAEAMQPWR